MENLKYLSNNKYNIIDNKINEGAYSKIYNVINVDDKQNKYIVKIQKINDRLEAINEIKYLNKLSKNKTKYFENIKHFFNNNKLNYNTESTKEYLNTSKIINLEDYYFDNNFIYIIFKKYEYTLEEFNILYNQEFKEVLPISVIKKFINSLFLGLYELNLSKIIHCDIKPNNIMISSKKNIKNLFKDIKKKKITKLNLINYIDLIYIDLNISQKCNEICRSTSVQTSYYMAPEIILGNRQFNYSIDIWSIGCIIYELITSKYLFDIYNWNEKNGVNYKFYTFENDSNISEDSENSYYSYDSEYNNKNNLILLYYYRELFGDNQYIHGKNINKYYNNKNLLGTINNIYYTDLSKFENYIKDNIDYNIDNDFYNNIIKLFNKIFLYDYTNRITIEEYFTNYIIL